MHGAITLELPRWVEAELDRLPQTGYTDPAQRMGFVLGLAREQVAEGTGGPFAAAVFDAVSGDLVSVGVNLVIPSHVPVAHAEIVAIALAGQAIGTHELAAAGRFELVSSTEPCAMCLGAVPWSGVVSLVTSARDEDARAIGFDEGNKPTDWVEDLESVGIRVTRDVLRDDGVRVLRDYAARGGVIYNGAAHPGPGSP